VSLPRNPSNPYTRVWESFLRSEATEDGRHDSPGWRAHEGPYALCLVRVPASALNPGLGRLRLELSNLSGVRLHPDHFLHITLQELGFVVDYPAKPDEISAARLEEFVQAAVEPIYLMRPFTIELGGANSFRDAVFLEVRPGQQLRQLHERLFELAAIPHVPQFPYLPHCTLAHYDGSTSVQAAAAAIGPARNEVFGGIGVSEIEIVLLDPGEPYPVLETFAAIPLGMA
jgi:2'-5' RNA ligase